jgi:hypothetical protein
VDQPAPLNATRRCIRFSSKAASSPGAGGFTTCAAKAAACERAAATHTGTGRAHAAAMPRHDVLDDRQAECQSAARAVERLLSLHEAVEQARQHVGGAHSGSG